MSPTVGWTVFGWQGITARLPEDWHLAALGGDRKAGYLRLDDSERPRLEIKWSDASVDIDKALDKYLQKHPDADKSKHKVKEPGGGHTPESLHKDLQHHTERLKHHLEEVEKPNPHGGNWSSQDEKRKKDHHRKELSRHQKAIEDKEKALKEMTKKKKPEPEDEAE